jgi:hypothetical protein
MKNKVFYTSAFTSALMFIVFFSSFNDSTYNFLFNSDTLYLPSIYKDIFIDNYGVKGWELNPAPNFFPDMTLYFLFSFLLGGNFIATSFIYSFIQYFIILFFIYKQFTLFLNKKDALYYISLGNIFFSLILVHFLVNKEIEFTFQVISNSFHLGSFIMSLWVGYLSIKYIEQSSIKKLVIITLLIFLASISDKLFIAQFVGTLLIVSSLYFLNKKYFIKSIVWLNIIAVTTALISLFILKKIPSSFISFGTPHSSIFNLKSIKDSFTYQFSHLYKIMSENWIGLFIILAIIIANLLAVYIILYKKRSTKQQAYWSVLALFIYNIYSFFLPILTGSYLGYDCIRYNINVYITSLVALPFLIYLVSNKKTSFILSLITWLVLVFFILLNIKTIKTPTQLSNFYPAKTQVIDELKDKYKLKNGISNYWYAKSNTMQSKNKVRIYSVHSNLAKYEHVTNYRWYYETADKKIPVFNFILINGDDEINSIKKIFPIYKLIEKRGVKLCITPDFIFEKNNPFPILLN